MRRTASLIALVALAATVSYAADTPAQSPGKGCNTELCQRVAKSTESFKDITATAVVEYKNDKVLAKIGKKYVQQFELKKALVRFKAPDKTRLEGALGALKFTYITNREFKIIRIKPIGYDKKESIVDKPHRRQDACDLGLITKDLWDQYVVESKGMSGEGDDECYVLDLTRGDEHSNLHRVWINKKNLYLTKLEKYDPDKVTMRLYYVYSEHKQIDGIWVPTKLEMYSKDGELAGISRIQDIKVNTGLADTLFK